MSKRRYLVCVLCPLHRLINAFVFPSFENAYYRYNFLQGKMLIRQLTATLPWTNKLTSLTILTHLPHYGMGLVNSLFPWGKARGLPGLICTMPILIRNKCLSIKFENNISSCDQSIKSFPLFPHSKIPDIQPREAYHCWWVTKTWLFQRISAACWSINVSNLASQKWTAKEAC